MFDPTKFNFTKLLIQTEGLFTWKTFPIEGCLIGQYVIEYNDRLEFYSINEIWLINGVEKEKNLYFGRIPDNDFGFQLLRNLELDLPIVQRDLKLDILL